MHSVPRSTEPDFLPPLRAAYSRWNHLSLTQQRQIRRALAEDFQFVCGYCERGCQEFEARTGSADEGTTDHFRPRSRFQDLSLDWLNLVYACYRCNQIKRDRWPGRGDQSVNDDLAAEDIRYVPPNEYVNPSSVEGQREAREYFDYDTETGQISPSERLDATDWSKARRTIFDIDLNDRDLPENDERHLWNRRLRQRDLLLRNLNAVEDFDARVNIFFEFMGPDKPFSGFIFAYVRKRFPAFGELFG